MQSLSVKTEPYMTMKITATLLLLLLVTDPLRGARILAINPTPLFSHQLPFRIIMSALAERGHDVTLITTHPLKDKPANLNQMDISFLQEVWRTYVNPVQLSNTAKSETIKFLAIGAEKCCEALFESPQIKEFLMSAEKFDVFISEVWLQWCALGIAHKVGSPPIIGFFSSGLYPTLYTALGNPYNPAYMPDFVTDNTSKMSFLERLYSAYLGQARYRSIMNSLYPPQERIMEKYLGPGLPSIFEMQYNLSMMLTTNHFSVSYPMPLQPHIVELTGLHIEKTRKPLPKDIQKFLDQAEEGVIYFSLGTFMKSEQLPADTVRFLVDAFAELPYRVLWKWELDTLPGQPDNVMISKWLPQQDVLAHPNVRLFITQGGLQSFNEMAYFGVPVVGIPFLGDQGYNVAKMVSAGIGMRILPEHITKESLMHAIKTVLGDRSYQENMRRFSAVYREHQEESLDKAIWAVEYVIRHNGAPHLRSAALDLRWWQLLLLDVAAVLTVAAFLFYKTACFVVNMLQRRPVPKTKRN